MSHVCSKSTNYSKDHMGLLPSGACWAAAIGDQLIQTQFPTALHPPSHSYVETGPVSGLCLLCETLFSAWKEVKGCLGKHGADVGLPWVQIPV
jgi:hypothetical protein